MKSKKEDDVTWTLGLFQTMLKDQKNMPQIIITNHNTTLMNSVAEVFPTSYALICRYHIIKNVISRLKPTIYIKQIKGKDEKMVKNGVWKE